MNLKAPRASEMHTLSQVSPALQTLARTKHSPEQSSVGATVRCIVLFVPGYVWINYIEIKISRITEVTLTREEQHSSGGEQLSGRWGGGWGRGGGCRAEAARGGGKTVLEEVDKVGGEGTRPAGLVEGGGADAWRGE